MKKITIFNVKPYNIFIDLDGKQDTNDIIVLGKGGKETVFLSEDRIKELKRELAGQVIFR